MNNFQSQLPPIGRVSKIIIVTQLIFFIIFSVIKSLSTLSIGSLFSVSGVVILNGYIWAILSYPFVSEDILSFLFNALIFWFIGSELERIWGEGKYIFTLLMISVVSALIYLGVVFIFFRQSGIFAYPIAGMFGLTTSLCVIYGIKFPERTMLLLMFPVKAKWFVAIIIGIQIYQGFFSPVGLNSWFCLLSIAVAYCCEELSFGKIKNMVTRKRKKKGHLHVLKNDDDITFH